MTPSLIRILIVDDHFMVRLGIIGALSEETDIQVVGEADDGRSAIDLFTKLKPDVTLMDGILPDFHGVEATRRIIAQYPEARIILVSINDTAEDVHRAMEAGAYSYLPKSSARGELPCAIRAVATGVRYLPENLKVKLTSRQISSTLSGREIEVLQLVALGKANKEIAIKLNLGEETIKSHIKHILTKLGAPDRTRAVTLAQEFGILRP